MSTDLSDFTGRLEELKQLQGQVKHFKEIAATHSADLLRSSKEIGSLRKQLEQITALQAEVDVLEKHNAELSTKLQDANRAIADADERAKKDAAKVEAYEAFTAAFRSAVASDD